MLQQEDFIRMIGEMQDHVEKTMEITDDLVSELDDKDLRYKLVALRQTKHAHLETMAALTSMLVRNLRTSRGETAETPARG